MCCQIWLNNNDSETNRKIIGCDDVDDDDDSVGFKVREGFLMCGYLLQSD